MQEEQFYTLSEIASFLDLSEYVLHFWVRRFNELQAKRHGDVFVYSRADLPFFEAIKHLLYERGYTISAVQKLLKQNGKNSLLNFLSESSKEQSAVHTGQEEEKDDKFPYTTSVIVEEDSENIDSLVGMPRAELDKDSKEILTDILSELMLCKRLLDPF